MIERVERLFHASFLPAAHNCRLTCLVVVISHGVAVRIASGRKFQDALNLIAKGGAHCKTTKEATQSVAEALLDEDEAFDLMLQAALDKTTDLLMRPTGVPHPSVQAVEDMLAASLADSFASWEDYVLEDLEDCVGLAEMSMQKAEPETEDETDKEVSGSQCPVRDLLHLLRRYGRLRKNGDAANLSQLAVRELFVPFICRKLRISRDLTRIEEDIHPTFTSSAAVNRVQCEVNSGEIKAYKLASLTRRGRQQLEEHLKFWNWLVPLVFEPLPETVILRGTIHLTYGDEPGKVSQIRLGKSTPPMHLSLEVLG